MAKRRCIAVAYSGGRDSTALLHSTLAQAAPLGIEVVALHVHHGLSANADAWLVHCEAQCKRWAARGWPVRLIAQRLAEGPRPGDSVEAWARRERYRALRTMALEAGATAVLLAHHRRDQAETVLLQALRGGGVAGLAGMPSSVERDGVTWLRPWLARSRAEIESYVHRHRLAHIDDESNDDPRFARNRLRLQVWPALAEAFGDAEATLASTAAWAAEASQALNELASIDLAPLARDDRLDVAAWRALSPARRGNALRAWLKRIAQGQAAPASLMQRLLDELPVQRAARWPHPAGELRLYRGMLRFDRGAAVSTPPTERETMLRIHRAGLHRLPGWGGSLHVARVTEGGVPLAWLGHVELKARQGAEQFQAGVGRPPRSLKKQFQNAGIAAWDRNGPLLYSGGQLVYVPGLGLDARVIGLPGQPLVTLQWVQDQPTARSG
ncbi:MAG TPA: tRNA lysidine(34) synthetase TilS [Burkholderiaceae bacterium]|nr:tRNA lysidine(34) synthetase TilS [Burkholderiaceae bacterium]